MVADVVWSDARACRRHARRWRYELSYWRIKGDARIVLRTRQVRVAWARRAWPSARQQASICDAPPPVASVDRRQLWPTAPSEAAFVAHTHTHRTKPYSRERFFGANFATSCSKKVKFPILVTERWARSWSRCTGSQPAGGVKWITPYT